MRHSFNVSFMTLLGLFLLSFGKTHNPVSLISSREGEIILKFQLPEYSITQVKINGKNCSKIAIPFAAISLDKGYPEVPYFSQNVAIPIDARNIIVEIIDPRSMSDFPRVNHSLGSVTVSVAGSVLAQVLDSPIYFYREETGENKVVAFFNISPVVE